MQKPRILTGGFWDTWKGSIPLWDRTRESGFGQFCQSPFSKLVSGNPCQVLQMIPTDGKGTLVSKTRYISRKEQGLAAVFPSFPASLSENPHPRPGTNDPEPEMPKTTDQISEYSLGVSNRLVIRERISLSAYSGMALIFFHSGSETNLLQAPFLALSSGNTSR